MGRGRADQPNPTVWCWPLPLKPSDEEAGQPAGPAYGSLNSSENHWLTSVCSQSVFDCRLSQQRSSGFLTATFKMICA